VEGNVDPVTLRKRFAAAKHELWSGLINVMDKMAEEEVAEKSSEDIVLLAGQRLQILMANVEKKLKGAE
jgi:hypothetical protein